MIVNRESSKKSVIVIILILLCLVCIIPLLVFSFFAIPATDDISNAYNVSKYVAETGSLFSAAIVYTIKLYEGVGGYYSAAFMNFFFSPLLRAEIMGMRWSLFIVNIVFFVSLYFFISVIVKLYTSSVKIRLLFYTILVFFIVNNYMNNDIFTWYGGNVAYLLPISFMLMGLSLYIRGLVNHKMVLIIGACFCGIIASGASLNVVTLNCILYILFFFLWLVKNNTIGLSRYSVTPVTMSIIGGLVNLLAPGNYIRHDSIRLDYNVIESVVISAKFVINRYIFLIRNTPFVGLLLITCLVSLFYIKKGFFIEKKPHKHSLLLLILVPILTMIVNYPVILGYGGSYVPARCLFVQDLTIYLFSAFWIVYFCCYLNEKEILEKMAWVNNTKKRMIIVVILTVLILEPIINRYKIDRSIAPGYEITSLYLINTILDGSAMSYSQYNEKMYYEIKNSDEKNVVYKYDSGIKSNHMINNIGLSDNATFYVNDAFAKLYGKNSIVVIKGG